MAKSITNATAVYTIMILVFAAGMWAILAFGSTLRAQPDLAGDWQLIPEGDPKQEVLRATIDQSGRYLRLVTATETVNLVMDRNASGDASRIELRGKSAHAAFDATPAVDVYRLTLQSPRHPLKRFTARITSRTYARPASAQQHKREQETEKQRQMIETNQTTQPQSISQPSR